MKYRHRPTEVTAMELTDASALAVITWLGEAYRGHYKDENGVLRVEILDRTTKTKASVGNWVVVDGSGVRVYSAPRFADDFEALENEDVQYGVRGAGLCKCGCGKPAARGQVYFERSHAPFGTFGLDHHGKEVAK